MAKRQNKVTHLAARVTMEQARLFRKIAQRQGVYPSELLRQLIEEKLDAHRAR